MEQLFNNLLSNAIKFSPKGTDIKVVHRDNGGEKQCIIISDRGPGIPQQDLDAIFDRYYQVKRKKVSLKLGFGTGLGLYIARKIMDLHDGAIRAENRPEGGCCFTLKIPCSGTS